MQRKKNKFNVTKVNRGNWRGSTPHFKICSTWHIFPIERDREQWYRRGGESSLIIQLPQFMPLQSNNDRGEKEVGEEATPSKTMRNWVKKWTLTKTEEITKSRKATM
ncbi:hypothetical protein F2Q69_00035719 [Brassica cretica]|uniref:Uncharacterized protein n=1 Tax=Brassica cretica TaxID=69181 RepID=A0A8S9STR1_BRACR|nr:hypothetical protein F2Q69_00035719 [Brassica cretica]